MNKLCMTMAQCNSLELDLRPGDIIAHQPEKLCAGSLTVFGTDNSDDFSADHIFQFCGKIWRGILGQTIEADGKKVNPHLFSEYFYDLTKGNCRLEVWRWKSLTPLQLNSILAMWNQMNGKPYNWFIIAGFTIWGIFNKFLPVVGNWISNHMSNPGVVRDKNGNIISYVCSIQVVDSHKKEIEFYNLLTKWKKIENATPDNLRATCKKLAELGFMERVADTFSIAKYGTLLPTK